MRALLTILVQGVSLSRLPKQNLQLRLAILCCSSVLFCASSAAHEPHVIDVKFAPDGMSVLAVSQAGLAQYSWPSLEKLKTVKLEAPSQHCLEFSPKNKSVAVGGGYPAEEGYLQTVSWPELKVLSEIVVHSDSVHSLLWSGENEVVTSSMDRSVKVWNVADRVSENAFEPTRILNGHSRSVDSIAFVESKGLLATTGVDQSVRVWDLATGELQRSLTQHTKPINSLAVRPSETGLPMLASAAQDRTIRFWQPTIGRMVRYVRLNSVPLRILWLDETRIAASCVDGQVRIIDADEVTVLQVLKGIDEWAYAFDAHPTDGSLVVAGSEGQIVRVVLE